MMMTALFASPRNRLRLAAAAALALAGGIALLLLA